MQCLLPGADGALEICPRLGDAGLLEALLGGAALGDRGDGAESPLSLGMLSLVWGYWAMLGSGCSLGTGVAGDAQA